MTPRAPHANAQRDGAAWRHHIPALTVRERCATIALRKGSGEIRETVESLQIGPHVEAGRSLVLLLRGDAGRYGVSVMRSPIVPDGLRSVVRQHTGMTTRPVLS